MSGESENLTPEQAADRLGWSKKTVYRWLRAGWIPAATQLPNKRYVIPASAVDELVSAQPTEAAS